GEAAEPAPPEDEPVGEHLRADAPDPRAEVAQPPAALEERLPPPPPVDARRRALEPHRVAVRQPERGEEHREGVAHEGRVEVLEVPRADDDEGGQRDGDDQAPRGRSGGFSGHEDLEARRRGAPAVTSATTG